MFLDTIRRIFLLNVLFLTQIAFSQEITRDWPQWGGSSYRNNAPKSGPLVSQFDIESGENIRWSVPLGTETYGNPVVADGKIFVGTNNGSGFVERLPPDIDLGVLVCLKQSDGSFLWQHGSEKLASGRAQDWPNIGICCSPLVENNRLWYVTSRGEVVCLDTEGFWDDKNDGSIQSEEHTNKNDADVIWRFDMMKELGISQHNMCSSSVTASGNRLFVLTGNGIDGDHKQIPAPNAPSFICLDRNSGDLLWADSTPGENILHGQWSSPACGVIGGVEQVVFAGGDGWIYSFDPVGELGPDGNGRGKLLWRFDANPKDSVFSMRNATRLHPIGTPVIYKDQVLIALGEDPEHGEGPGVLWSIDGTKRGDVSPTMVVNASGQEIVPRRRVQAMDRDAGEREYQILIPLRYGNTRELTIRNARQHCIARVPRLRLRTDFWLLWILVVWHTVWILRPENRGGLMIWKPRRGAPH